MGIEGRNFVLKNYNWEDNVDKMLKLFEELIEKKNIECRIQNKENNKSTNEMTANSQRHKAIFPIH